MQERTLRKVVNCSTLELPLLSSARTTSKPLGEARGAARRHEEVEHARLVNGRTEAIMGGLEQESDMEASDDMKALAEGGREGLRSAGAAQVTSEGGEACKGEPSTEK